MANGTRELPGAALLSDLVVRVDHVGICVKDIDAAAAPWTRLFGTPVEDRERVASQRVAVGWLALPGAETRIELLSPEGNEALDRFLAKRGDAMHHVAVAVTDIHEAVRRIADAGLELIDRAPRLGAAGHLVAFLHPRAMGGVLVELVHAPAAAHS